MEVCFLSVNDISLVGGATFCSILKLSCAFIRRYIVPHILPIKKLLLPTKYEILPFVVRQNGANTHSSVPTSLCYLAMNPYTSVVDFIYFRRLVEPALHSESLSVYLM